MASQTLYTLKILGLSTSLANFPLRPDMTLSGEFVSKVCGSRVMAGVRCDADGVVESAGGKVSSCAIGQASAAILFAAAVGRDRATIEVAYQQLKSYLAGMEGDVGDWPLLTEIANVRRHPGRHQAVLLPWQATLDALENALSQSRSLKA